MKQTRKAANLIQAYLEQGAQYYSESKGTMIPIAEMAPAHAANAAEAVLGSAPFWAIEAGQGRPLRPYSWLARTPLLLALAERSQALSPPTAVKDEILPDAWRCQQCSFVTVTHERALGHQISTGHQVR